MTRKKSLVSLDTPVYTSNKSHRNDITEIPLEVVTIANLSLYHYRRRSGLFDVPELNRQLSMESSVIAETMDEVVEFDKLAVEDENKIIQDEAVEVGTVFFFNCFC